MRGIFRRPFGAVICGSYLAVGGVALGAAALFAFEPRHLMVGATLVFVGISFAGIWPADRDLNDHDTRTWQRFAPWALWSPLAAAGVDIVLPVSDFIATFLIGAAFAALSVGNIWFVSHGVPLEDHHIEAELAKPGHNPNLGLVTARPGRWGKAARIVALSIASVIALLIIGGSAIIVWQTTRHEPYLASRARWTDLPARYCLDTHLDGYVDDETFAATVERAFERWGVPAESTGECARSMRLGDGVSSIGWHFRGTGEDWLGAAPRVGSCDFFCNSRERRSIGEADIWIEPMPEDYYANSDCLDDVMLHEVGHFLGLDHAEEGVMAPGRACYGEQFTSSDLAALFDRYGDEIQPKYGSAARE